MHPCEKEYVSCYPHSPITHSCQTLKVLCKVDPNIVQTYYDQMLQFSGSLPGPREQEEAAQRLLEVINILYADNGEDYVQHVKKILKVVEAAVVNAKPHLIQTAVEDVLSKIRNGKPHHRRYLYCLLRRVANPTHRSGCVGVFSAILEATATDSDIGPTMSVIISAVLCEYLEFSPSAPSSILKNLSSLLPMHNGKLLSRLMDGFYLYGDLAAIQDALLICMVRVACSCDEVPDNVLGVVNNISEQAGRHIKRVC